jgi:hypothetical protein
MDSEDLEMYELFHEAALIRLEQLLASRSGKELKPSASIEKLLAMIERIEIKIEEIHASIEA